jgi:hypothetical protein
MEAEHVLDQSQIFQSEVFSVKRENHLTKGITCLNLLLEGDSYWTVNSATIPI